MEHDVGKLEEMVRDLDTHLKKLADLDPGRRLPPVLRRPGWTTPAEFLLFVAGIESLSRQAQTMTAQLEATFEAAEGVEGSP